MGINWIELIGFGLGLMVATPVMAKWLTGVYRLSTVSKRWDTTVLRVMGLANAPQQTWKGYTKSLLGFHLIGGLVLLGLQFLQRALPLNPASLPNVPWHTAINTTISFVTNTNWQSYAGETTMSVLTQMMGLGVQNFLSAGVGIAVVFAMARGFSARENPYIGNLYQDLVRVVLYVLLPLSVAMSVVLVQQGVPQTLRHQISSSVAIPTGPIASQVAIKQLGTNGGGYLNTNSAHPYENPTPLTNMVSIWAILLIPSALVWAFGDWVGNRRHGRVLWGVMALFLAVGIAVSLGSEVTQFHHRTGQLNWEGKETRFGMTTSVLWSVATTAASSGSINSLIDSMTPVSGCVALFNMMLGEVIFGGVGSGLYGMVLVVLLTLFLSGLMVGRTPEYLGKKIDQPTMAWVIVGLLVPNLVILIAGAAVVALPAGLAGLLHHGPHGFSELIYAVTSATANNGSAMGGLTVNTPFYDLILGACMLLGRFGVMIPVLAIAGHFATQNVTPPTSGTLPIDTGLFAVLLAVSLLIVTGLTFFPTLCLGPIADHFATSTTRY